MDMDIDGVEVGPQIGGQVVDAAGGLDSAELRVQKEGLAEVLFEVEKQLVEHQTCCRSSAFEYSVVTQRLVSTPNKVER